jgi:polyisoprenoid-binding protein YceI
MATSSESLTQIPAGVWQVDPAASELGFGARGMFGLVPVHGHFRDFAGTLTVDDAGARGELTIQSASLDTHNKKRDTHLRSADFFHVDAHPLATFELTGVTATAGGVTVAGLLKIRDNALAIEAPAQVSTDEAGRLTIATALEVDRAAAGLGWSKLGMIKGKAKLSALVTLTK